jgi:hypothetical protein
MKRRFRPTVERLDGREVPTPTVTTLYASPDPSVYPQPIQFTAVVTGGDFEPGTVMPGATSWTPDTVTFYDDGVSFGTVPVVNGVATNTGIPLATGLHYITARYNGATANMTYGYFVNDPSTSGTLFQEVDPPPVVPVPVPVPQPQPVPVPAHHHHAAHHKHKPHHNTAHRAAR